MSGPKLKVPYVAHRDDAHGGGKAPMEPHMALVTNFGDGDPQSLLAIPPGATILFIEDPRRADGILAMTLEKVEYENHVLKGLRFRVSEAGKGSTRRLYLTAAWRGDYKSPLEAQTAGVVEQMDALGKKPGQD